jgi:hypothetical protein
MTPKLTRRTFIGSLVGALVVPRLALPSPAPEMVNEVAPELVAFHRGWIECDLGYIATEVVLWGGNARAALASDPSLWSAVMVDRRLT